MIVLVNLVFIRLNWKKVGNDIVLFISRIFFIENVIKEDVGDYILEVIRVR